MRLNRTVRSFIATAISAGALVALPAAASAAVDLAVTLDAPLTNPAEAGAATTLTITLSNDGADPAGSGIIQVNARGYNANGFEGEPRGLGFGALSKTDNDGNGALVDVSSGEIVIAPGFDASEDVVVTLPVTLPTEYTQNFHFNGAAGDTWAGTVISSTPDVTVSKGGPSSINVQPGLIIPAGADGLAGRWIKKDTNATSTLTVTNTGTGTAHYVGISADVFPQADGLLSPELPNPPFSSFSPTVTIGAGTCAVTSSYTCQIPSLAPGASVSIPVTLSGLTHYGSVSIGGNVEAKADSGFNVPSYCMMQSCVRDGSTQITDGTTIDPRIGFHTPARAAAGNTNVTFTGEITNAGGTEIKNAVLEVASNPFRGGVALNDGSPSYEGDTGVSQSLQSVTIPGATCANYVNPTNGKKQLDRLVCVIPSIAPSARLRMTAVANFATSVPNASGGFVVAELHSSAFAALSATTTDSAGVVLNVDKTSDVSVAVTSPALIGAGRVAPVTVKVTNTGNTKLDASNVQIAPQMPFGSFDADDQPAVCAPASGLGVFITPFSSARAGVRCTGGELAPGASRSVTVFIKAGAKLGSLPVQVNVFGLGDGIDLNPDNDWAVQTLKIVKANAVPFLGVKVAKAAAVKRSVLGKKGVKTTVQVPGASVVKVSLVVTPKVAKQLGLIKKAGKKSVTIGTATKKMTKAGKVVVTTKIGKRYAAKIAKAKAKFAAKKVTMVTSTNAKTAGATSMTTQTIAVK